MDTQFGGGTDNNAALFSKNSDTYLGINTYQTRLLIQTSVATSIN